MLTTFGCGFFSVKTCMALTWSSAVIGLSPEMVSGTALPFSISGGTSIFTLPFLTGASPTTFRIAARIDAGVAEAGLTASESPAAPASAAVSTRKRRRVACRMSSVHHGFCSSRRVAR